jgi:hypothetical protein
MMVRLISAAGGSHGNAFRHNTMAMGSPEREELGGALPAFDGLIPYKRFPTPAHRARRA